MKKRANQSFEEIKKIYSYTLIADEEFKKLYDLAESDNSNIHGLVMTYLKEHMNINIMKSYLDSLNIDLTLSPSLIKTKLLTFFKLLDRTEYFLTPSDIEQLLEEKVFSIVLDKKFKNKKEIEYNLLIKFTSDNFNFLTLIEKYLEINNITIIKSEETDEDLKSRLSYKDEIELIKKIRSGDRDAYNKMTELNLKLVQKIARRYINLGLDWDDLVQYGLIGFMKAIDRFDETKGYAFSTYATWWIRQGIKRALSDYGRTIRIPVHRVDEFRKMNNAINELGINLDDPNDFKKLASYLKWSEKKLNEVLKGEKSITSLDSKVGDDEKDDLYNVIKDDKTNVAEEAIENYTKSYLEELLKEKLNDREILILSLYFGLEDGRKHTLEEIGEILNITRERVRQIKKKALKKLEHNKDLKNLYNGTNETVLFPKKAEIKETVFNIKTIHSKMTFDLLINLLKIFPEKDQKYYIKYRRISLNHHCILPAKPKEYPDNFLAYMKVVEQDLKVIADYYFELDDKIEDENQKFLKVKDYIVDRSIRFRYPDFSLKEIKEVVKKLPDEYQEIVYIKHGKTLLNYYEFPKEKLDYYNEIINYIYNKIGAILENKEEIHPKSLRAKYPELSFEELNECVKKLPTKRQKVVYLRHGKFLDQYLKFPKNKTNYYYSAYYFAIKQLDELIKTKDYEDKNEIHPKSLRAKYPELSFEELNEYVKKLSIKRQEIIYLRHGKFLNQYLKLSKNRSNSLYYFAIEQLDELIKTKNYENKDEILQKSLRAKYPELSFEELNECIKKLTIKRQKVIYLRHGEFLDQYLKFPKDKANNYYSTYRFATKQLDELIKMKVYENKDEIHPKSLRAKYSELSFEELNECVKKLPTKRQEVVYLRHGKFLNQYLKFPKDKANNYYYTTNHYALGQLDELIKMKAYENKDEIHSKSLIAKYQELSFEELNECVKKLSIKRQKVVYLRHGEFLDQYLKFPKDKANNYYYNIYHIAIKHLDELIKTKDYENKNGIHPKSLRAKYPELSFEELNECVKKLSIKRQEAVYLRHGEFLDQYLKFPKDRSNGLYYFAIKQLNELIKEVKHEEIPNQANVNKNLKLSKKTSNAMVPKKQEIVQDFNKLKEVLKDKKIQNFMARMFDKYFTLYGKFITNEKLEEIIKCTINCYFVQKEGLSLELYANFKIETEIVLILVNKYRKDPDSEESLEILMLLEEIFGNKIRKRFTNTTGNIPYCYISDYYISKVIEKAVLEYNGDRPFTTEVSLNLERLKN